MFDGCQFYFSGNFCPPHPSKEDLVQMVKYGGGKVLSREPKPDVNKSLCLPTTRESNKAPNHAVTLAPIAYHANPSSKQYRCTQYVIYDSLAEKKPHFRNTGSVCSMPSTWLMDCASNFTILDLKWVVLVTYGQLTPRWIHSYHQRLNSYWDSTKSKGQLGQKEINLAEIEALKAYK